MYMNNLNEEVEFEKVMSSHLDKIFSKIRRHNGELRGIHFSWLSDLNDEPMLVWNTDSFEFGMNVGIRKDLWNLVKSLFSLNSEETSEVIGNWFTKKTRKKPTEIYTF